jgi:hypothetical protein
VVDPRPGWEPLKLHTIERKSKQVEAPSDFLINVFLTDRQYRDLETIRDLIAKGGDLPRFYRRSKGTDWLLRNRAIMHLHLGSQGSNELLYLIQYSDHVLWLRVDSHIHLEDVPPGKRLPLLPIRKFEQTLRKTLMGGAR